MVFSFNFSAAEKKAHSRFFEAKQVHFGKKKKKQTDQNYLILLGVTFVVSH